MPFAGFLWIILLAVPGLTWSQQDQLSTQYRKLDTLIPMRDGKKLYTAIYLPRDDSKKYPILMERTPYSAGPYGPDRFPSRLGPNRGLTREGYIFVKQDVRGRYMSEGHNLEVTPHRPGKKTKTKWMKVRMLTTPLNFCSG